MTEINDQNLQQFLKRSIPPSSAELQRDLWPRMLRKLDERPIRVPWFDWVLVALLAIFLCAVPRAIPVLLYHL